MDFGNPFKNRLSHSFESWLPQLRSNLPDIFLNPLSHLVPEVERVGVAVAAGPSATKNVELLKDRGDVVVCAADRAAAQFGHLFRRFYSCTSDTSPAVAKFYEQMPIPQAAVCPIFVHQLVVKVLRDRKISHYYYTPALKDDTDKELELINKILLDLTSAPLLYGIADAGSTAFRLLIGLGCKRIGLVGYDMSEPYDKPFHEWSLYPAYKAFMTQHEISQEEMFSRMNVTERIHNTYGTKYVTDSQWNSYRARMYRLIEQAQKSGIETINCFPPGTVLAGPLPAPIEGRTMKVLGIDGRLHVGTRRKRHYAGSLIRVRVRCHYPVLCTPEHPFLTISLRNKRRGRNGRRELHRYRTFQPRWKAAEDLRDGDMLMATTFRRPSGYSQIVLRVGRGRKSFPPKIANSDDLLWFLGLYAGDGSRVGPNSGNIALHVSQTEELVRAQRILRETFQLDSNVRQIGKCNVLTFNSADLMDNLVQWCGATSKTKRLPKFAVTSAATFEGLLAADGYSGKRENIISTVSPTLAHQVFYGLLARRKYSSIQLRAGETPGRFLNASNIYAVSESKGNWHYTRWWRWFNGTRRWYYLMPVLAVERTRFEGYVYNRTVPVGESYAIGGGIISHNCSEGGSLDATFLSCTTLAKFLSEKA